jgi:uncharacterized membrane protein
MSSRLLRRIALALAILGIAVAAYLTYIHYAHVNPICNIAHGCETVQKSEWSKLMGIPVAVLGLGGYLVIFAALVVDGEYGRLTAALFSLAGFGFSMYLTYREIFTIEAICQWCVASAVILTLLAIVSVWRLLIVEPVAPTT